MDRYEKCTEDLMRGPVDASGQDPQKHRNQCADRQKRERNAAYYAGLHFTVSVSRKSLQGRPLQIIVLSNDKHRLAETAGEARR